MTSQFYAEPGYMTTMLDPTLFNSLPTDTELLRNLVSNLIIHPDTFHNYGLDTPADLTEINLRPVDAMVDQIRARCDWPLTQARPPEKRLIGSCRHYSVLLCSILRAAHVPSRVRSGFADYFDAVNWEDHWITEYWNVKKHGWQRVDAELDDVLIRKFGILFDPADVPLSAFLPGPEVWRRYRANDIDAGLFGIQANRGPRFIAGTVVRDLAALNKFEMLPWDYWGYIYDLTSGKANLDVRLIDSLADAVIEGEHGALTRAFQQPGIAVPTDMRDVIADR